MQSIDSGLLKFCLKHSDGEGLKDFGDRPKEDWEWLRAALQGVETPGERMKQLVVKEFMPATDAERMRFCLAQMLDELEDVDQVSVLVNVGGLPALLAACRHGDREVRLLALQAVQLALKNNEPVKARARLLGALPFLLQVLGDRNEEVPVRSRALAAVAALIEHVPELQDAFVREGGLDFASDLCGASVEPRLAFRAVFALSWLLSTRPELLPAFRQHAQLRAALTHWAAAQGPADLCEAAAELLSK